MDALSVFDEISWIPGQACLYFLRIVKMRYRKSLANHCAPRALPLPCFFC